MKKSSRKYVVLFALIAVSIIGLVAATNMYVGSTARPIDENTGACACDDPDYYELLWLEKGVPCYREVTTVMFIAEPRHLVVPEELSWLDYGIRPGIPPTAKFWMGGVPDVTGTFLCSFDVVGIGHVHLEFVIWEK